MKRVLVAALTVLALLVSGATLVPFLLPADAWKPQLVERVKQATGRELRIDGAMRLSVLPRLALEIDDVGLSNPVGPAGPAGPGGSKTDKSPELVRLRKLRLVIELLPLLGGDIAVDSFVLESPAITLAIDKEGRANWALTAAAPETAAETGPEGPGSVRKLSLSDLRISGGSVRYVDSRSGTEEQFTEVDLKLALPGFDQPLHAEGRFTWNEKPVSVELAVRNPRALFDGGTSPVTAHLAAESASLHYDGEAKGTPPARLSGGIDVQVESIRTLAAWTGSPIRTPGQAFGPLHIAGSIALSGSTAEFSDAKIALDDLHASGGLTIHNDGAKPRLAGNLDIDRLDLDFYLPMPGSQPASRDAEGATRGGWSDDPVDLGELQRIDAEFDLGVGQMQLRGVRVGSGTVAMHLKNGRLAMEFHRFALYGGSGQGSLVLDGSITNSTGAEGDFHLGEIDAGAFLHDAAGLDRVTGHGDFDFAFGGRGASQRQFVQSLQGKGRIDLRRGSIHGINLAGMVLRVASAFTRDNAADRTDFSTLGGTFTISGGVVNNRDLALQSPDLRVAGAGAVDLNKRSVDYRVEPKFVAPLVGRIGFGALGVKVPVRIRGPWGNLIFEPDLAGFVEQGLDVPTSLFEGAKGLTRLPGDLLGRRKAP